MSSTFVSKTISEQVLIYYALKWINNKFYVNMYLNISDSFTTKQLSGQYIGITGKIFCQACERFNRLDFIMDFSESLEIVKKQTYKICLTAANQNQNTNANENENKSSDHWTLHLQLLASLSTLFVAMNYSSLQPNMTMHCSSTFALSEFFFTPFCNLYKNKNELFGIRDKKI